MNPPRWNQIRPLRPDGRPLFGSLLPNGNMEDAQPGGKWPASWYRSKHCVQWSKTKSVGSGHSLCIEDDPQGAGESGQWRSQALKVEPGSIYTLSWSWHYNKASEIDAFIRFFEHPNLRIVSYVSNKSKSIKQRLAHPPFNIVGKRPAIFQEWKILESVLESFTLKTPTNKLPRFTT